LIYFFSDYHFYQFSIGDVMVSLNLWASLYSNPHREHQIFAKSDMDLRNTEKVMVFRIRPGLLLALTRSSTGHCVDLACQQKGQYVLGQQGLNAGVVPEPGIDVIDIGNRPTYNSELTRL
jgi:hypothetical protein